MITFFFLFSLNYAFNVSNHTTYHVQMHDLFFSILFFFKALLCKNKLFIENKERKCEYE